MGLDLDIHIENIQHNLNYPVIGILSSMQVYDVSCLDAQLNAAVVTYINPRIAIDVTSGKVTTYALGTNK